ncbi:growth hormone receptor-like isoform X3 [Carassius auratus]|uniref:Growth hormone receptor-like isoform X3 n=1 Tax=Carassius auratus TaxID=7957 RepID=A0A6P6JU82_CARAU|nr:growth hormone receptor-like isoform X3 [Carassius auratus]
MAKGRIFTAAARPTWRSSPAGGIRSLIRTTSPTRSCTPWDVMSPHSERAPQECPDYVSGGINSCFFDAKHTQIWEMYCMNVTAHTHTGPITSRKHCLDVVEIVETDPPFNLTYIMLNESIGEVGRSVLVSWLHPIESLVHEQLVMLVYELRYRNLAQPDNWRVMERLREPHVEFLDLPVGRYEFSVRCRTTSNKHWSVWSESIIVTINGRALSDQMLALILVTSIAIMIFLFISLGNIRRGMCRIKSFLLPAIPKPRIPGLEPALLKKGKIDEIDQHFSSFHGYRSPQYCTETCSHVSVDTRPAVTPSIIQSDGIQEDVLIRTITPSVLIGPIKQYVTCPDGQQSVQTNCTPAPYCHSPAPYSEEDTPPADPGPAHPELTSVPGMNYSMILSPAPTTPPTQDFYTCVNGVMPSGALHLVPYLLFNQRPDDEAEKKSQLATLLEMQKEVLLSTIESNPSEAGMPS